MQRLQLALCCSLVAHAIIFFYWPALDKPSSNIRPTLQLTLKAPTAESVASSLTPASNSERTAEPQSKQPQSIAAPSNVQQSIVSRRPKPQPAVTPLNRQLPNDLDFEQPATGSVFAPRLGQALQQQRRERAARESAHTAERQPDVQALPGDNLYFVRSGKHCFLHQPADPLDEDSFDIWSPVACRD